MTDGDMDGDMRSREQGSPLPMLTFSHSLITTHTLPITLPRCCSSKDEDDFRPLFDNFVQDLLTTLNLPEWPASELLLTLLGMLLVST